MTADPNACRWCTRDERSHSIEWSEGKGFHGWAAPTDAQRLARMVDRREEAK